MQTRKVKQRTNIAHVKQCPNAHPWLQWTGTRVSDENHANGLFYRRLCAQLAFVVSSPLLYKARAVFRIAHLENLGSFSIDLAAKIGVALGAALSASGDANWVNWVRTSIVSSCALPVSHPHCSWTSVRPPGVVLRGRRSALPRHSLNHLSPRTRKTLPCCHYCPSSTTLLRHAD
ncbi:hypothetical protein SNOG_20035 [Parastagonospora nodorum SN15]|uniref:Uncharacterized protein n=1 Tax=Phaeosphaeria nodorum (strain SN15 / ATCC MYA-4574 / FGSC 10173) TaxID=321614 RepID=A9JX32_PHANO|nr:hypothetical protein SNOG_20035 [Parastagonospora nodorum SN15]EDP89891.1 hypothetical protein SNOG_20035 [Parastagonospora nodorum SN15]